MIFNAQLDVISISNRKCLRNSKKTGNLSELTQDEYYTFSMYVRNNESYDFTWERAFVRVDDGEAWYWAKGKIEPSKSGVFRIAHINMKKCITPGKHTVVWYFDEQEVYREHFLITQNMKWENVFPFPSEKDIIKYQYSNKRRSPYISGWLYIPQETRYTEYMIDFKADHLPRGTYCCLGNWTMDYSELEKKYKTVRTEYRGVSAYAGFQKIATEQMVSIMSFWDVYVTDEAGVESKIRVERLYPDIVVGAGEFKGEGTGARSIVPYRWEDKHWYRMNIRCRVSQKTGNTIVEQWVCDLETEEYILLCSYDTGVKNSAMKGSIAVFLENFLPETAGEVRSMEVCNARYLEAGKKQWKDIESVYVSSRGGIPGYEGSYNFGIDENRLFMITSGIGGDWFYNGRGKMGTTFWFPVK